MTLRIVLIAKFAQHQPVIAAFGDFLRRLRPPGPDRCPNTRANVPCPRGCILAPKVGKPSLAIMTSGRDSAARSDVSPVQPGAVLLQSHANM